MRILHVTNWLPGCHHISGGAEAVCLNTINMAREAGHECAAFCLPLELRSPHDFPIYEADTVFGHIPQRLHVPVDLVRSVWRPVDGYTARSLARALRDFRPHLVHFHKFERLGYSVVPAAARSGASTIWSVYDYLAFCPGTYLQRREGGYCTEGQGARCYDCYRPGRRFPQLQRALYHLRPRVIRTNLRPLDRVVVLSERCAQIIAEHGIPKDKIRVIYQSYPVAETAPPDPADVDAETVLFAGWLVPAKGLHVALEAMGQVVSVRHSARLLVLGMGGSEPWYAELLEGILAGHNLRPFVTFAGKLPRTEFLAHLRRAAVVVVPEQWENMSPVIVVEAMAHGKPVVASQVGGIPEFVRDGETGWLAEPDHPGQFAAGILKVLNDPAGALRMGIRARERALELFDRPVAGRKLLELYQECLDLREARHDWC